MRILEETGVELKTLSTSVDVTVPAPSTATRNRDSLAAMASGGGLTSFSCLEHTNWTTGEPTFLYQDIQVDQRALYARVFGAQDRIGEFSLGYALIVALAAVDGLFLIIEFTTLVMGLALARSITDRFTNSSWGLRTSVGVTSDIGSWCRHATSSASWPSRSTP